MLTNLFQPLLLNVTELPDSLHFRNQSVVESLQLLSGLVEHPGVNLGSQQIVGGRDCVDVPGEVEVELVHGDDLRVAPTSSPALDPEGRSLAGLPHTGEHVLVELGADGLDEADGGGGLALAQRGGSDPRHTDVLPTPSGGESLQSAQTHLGLLLPVQVYLRGQETNL